METFCVLLLAGGKSSRMGRDKARLLWEGSSFLSRIASQLDDFSEKYISLARAEELLPPSWKIVEDVYPGCGPVGGLHAALSVCRAPWLFAVSCDLPRLEKPLITYLMGFADETSDVVLPVTPDGRMHPLCAAYRKSLAGAFEAQLLSGNYRLQNALSPFRVRRIPIGAEHGYAGMLANINTPEDYQSLLRGQI
jgi:molybdopterin-guanine dinucleotide biosynthesis protein A